MRYAALLLALAACDESPFGTRHAPAGEAKLGTLEVQGCAPIAPGFPMTGLGNGDFFYIANSSPPQLYAFDPSGNTFVPHGNRLDNAAPEPIFDVAVRRGHCPYVSTAHAILPVQFMSGDCDSSDSNYPVGPVVFAFDSTGNVYFVRPDNGLFGKFTAAGEQSAADVPVRAVRLTINNTRNEIWIAYQPSSSSWDMLVFDTGTLKQTGHIDFPWQQGDLAGMEWDDNTPNLVGIANQPAPGVCTFDFVPASL